MSEPDISRPYHSPTLEKFRLASISAQQDMDEAAAHFNGWVGKLYQMWKTQAAEIEALTARVAALEKPAASVSPADPR